MREHNGYKISTRIGDSMEKVSLKEYLYQKFLANDFRDRLKHKFGDDKWVEISEKTNKDAIQYIDK